MSTHELSFLRWLGRHRATPPPSHHRPIPTAGADSCPPRQSPCPSHYRSSAESVVAAVSRRCRYWCVGRLWGGRLRRLDSSGWPSLCEGLCVEMDSHSASLRAGLRFGRNDRYGRRARFGSKLPKQQTARNGDVWGRRLRRLRRLKSCATGNGHGCRLKPAVPARATPPKRHGGRRHARPTERPTAGRRLRRLRRLKTCATKNGDGRRGLRAIPALQEPPAAAGLAWAR